MRLALAIKKTAAYARNASEYIAAVAARNEPRGRVSAERSRIERERNRRSRDRIAPAAIGREHRTTISRCAKIKLLPSKRLCL